MARPTWRYADDLDRLRQEWGGRCVMCGRGHAYRYRTAEGQWRSRRLEFAHLRSTGLYGHSRGLRQRYLDVVRHPNHYVLVCWPCHRFRIDFFDDESVRHTLDLQQEVVRAAMGDRWPRAA